jgi:pimeloyl-ACP methyl ester carboxylesterase
VVTAAAPIIRTHRLPLGDGHLVVAEAGAGPPLLLLHGWGRDRRHWDRLLPALAPTHRCLAPDLRGAGESSPPPGGGEGTWDSTVEDVAAVARWAGAPRPLLVGASWGGKFALVYAARGHPCAGVVCADGIAFGTAGSLREDVYARIACPVRVVFAERSAIDQRDWPYTRATIAAFAARHPALEISWLPCGHDIAVELPGALAAVLRAFSSRVRPA